MKTLRQKFFFTLLAVLALNMAASFISFVTIFDQKEDGVVINLAGRQRMLSQKMTKQALMLQHDGSIKDQLAKTTALFDQTLQGLMHGNREMRLPPCNDPVILAQLQKVEQLWKPFLKAMAAWSETSGTDKQSLAYILANNETLLAEMNKAVGLMEKSTTSGSRRLLWTQGVVVPLLMAVLLAAWQGIIAPLVRRLDGIISSASDSARQVALAAEEINSSSQSLAQGATEQAASLQETSASLEEISAQTSRNANNAGQASTNMSETQRQVGEGALAVRNMNDSMNEINKSSAEIGKIINTIEEIAFQTNLLALNAAVEAARAGDAGKGFAVVADEVRNLAQRSAEASRNTSALITDTVNRVRHGTAIANDMRKRFSGIESSVSKVSGLIDEIAVASDEQATGVEQVNTAVAHMNQVTQQNTACSEEAAAASQELSTQADRLNSIVIDLTRLVRGNNGRDEQGRGVKFSRLEKDYHTPSDHPAISMYQAKSALPKNTFF